MLSNRCAVLGSPIVHSLSPVMHNAAYQHLGLDDWQYEAIELQEDDVPEFLAALDDSWRGLSVTAPLKHAVAQAATSRDEFVERTGVANTLVLSDGERRAYNTDIPGAVAALREHGVTAVDSAVIVGAGATAHSMIESLLTLGVNHISLLARRPDAATALTEKISAHVEIEVREIDTLLNDVDVLISTVPVSAVEPWVDEWASRAAAVFDVIYHPWPTPLAEKAVELGSAVTSGLDLLAHQASLQVELMTGSAVPVEVLRDAALQELARRA